MRIVHEFHGKDPCVGGGGNLYANDIRKKPEWPGFSVDLVICDTTQPKENREFWEGDTIHLEGNGETIREALKQALNVIDFAEKHAREMFAKRLAQTEQCNKCYCWVENDGNGNLIPHHACLTEGQPLCE